MSLIDRIEGFLIIGSVVSLLMIGLAMTLQSGIARVSSGPWTRQLIANLSQTLVLLGVCLVGLVILQQFVGFRMRPF